MRYFSRCVRVEQEDDVFLSTLRNYVGEAQLRADVSSGLVAERGPLAGDAEPFVAFLEEVLVGVVATWRGRG